MIISGHVKNNVIILDEKIKLLDGTKVNIMVPDNGTEKSSGLCGIWKDNRSAEEIANEIISSRSTGRDISL